MGLLTFLLAGTALIFLGIWEAFSVSNRLFTPNITHSKSSLFTFLFSSLISISFILNSSFSLADSLSSSDNIGVPIQLQTIAVTSLFLLYSLSGILTIKASHLFPFPIFVLDFVVLVAFTEEFLLFHSQLKDPSGLENQYYELLCVPISICMLSTVLSIRWLESPFPRLGRAFGLILHGTWFLQMGFSFYTHLMVHGCGLHKKSRGNFTIKCDSHLDAHRGMGIATLQFNCHLAFLVLFAVGVYWLIGSGRGDLRDHTAYKPIGEPTTHFEGPMQFTLYSDEDESSTSSTNRLKHGPVVSEERTNSFIQL